VRRPAPAPVVRFSKEETAALVRALQAYFDAELDQKLGDIPAQMLLDFLITTLGPAFYNRGLYDAQAIVAARMDDLGDAILGLEK
jgi:uncharacterized protein (DUF2164 family)